MQVRLAQYLGRSANNVSLLKLERPPCVSPGLVLAKAQRLGQSAPYGISAAIPGMNGLRHHYNRIAIEPDVQQG